MGWYPSDLARPGFEDGNAGGGGLLPLQMTPSASMDSLHTTHALFFLLKTFSLKLCGSGTFSGYGGKHRAEVAQRSPKHGERQRVHPTPPWVQSREQHLYSVPRDTMQRAASAGELADGHNTAYKAPLQDLALSTWPRGRRAGPPVLNRSRCSWLRDQPRQPTLRPSSLVTYL